MNWWRQLNIYCYGRVEWIASIVFFMPVFFLTVKSWVTTSVFLLFFICCWPVIKNPRHYFRNRSKEFWVMLVCLIMPFLSEVFAQIGRGQITSSSLDGPSRMFLAAGIFVYLSKSNPVKLIQGLSYGSAFGVMIVFLSLVTFSEYYWGNRAATYFVDPITLPCYTVGLLGLVLFWGRRVFPGDVDVFCKVVLTIIAGYIVVESQSRSAFVAIAFLLATYVVFYFRFSFKLQISGLVSLILGLIFVYFISEIVQNRVNASVSGVLAFLFPDEFSSSTIWSTSSGQRIILGLIDLHLMKSNPLFGVGDRSPLPPYEELLVVIPMLNKEIYEIKVLAGSHSELLAKLVRQGFIFGVLSLGSLFFYPLYLLLWKHRKLTFAIESPLAVGLGMFLPILASALTIQVFNLKMTMSFYGIFLAIFFAYLCWSVESKIANPIN